MKCVLYWTLWIKKGFYFTLFACNFAQFDPFPFRLFFGLKALLKASSTLLKAQMHFLEFISKTHRMWIWMWRSPSKKENNGNPIKGPKKMSALPSNRKVSSPSFKKNSPLPILTLTPSSTLFRPQNKVLKLFQKTYKAC